MPPILRKILLLMFFLVLFALTILYIEPPSNWESASIIQILAFFIPLLFSATLLIDIFLKYLPHSFIFALGLVLGLAFYAVNQLDYLTGALVLLVTIFSWRVFPKMRLPRFRLTYGPKIPKLHIQKQEPSRISKMRRLRRLRNV